MDLTQRRGGAETQRGDEKMGREGCGLPIKRAGNEEKRDELDGNARGGLPSGELDGGGGGVFMRDGSGRAEGSLMSHPPDQVRSIS